MRTRLFLYLLGWVSIEAGAALLLPAPFSLADGDGILWAFVLPAVCFFAVGFRMVHAGREHPERVLVREGACALVGAWLLLTAAATMPYMLSAALSPPDALSEGVSGITTTGLTLLGGDVPRSLVFWRSLTQWLGGVYIILLLVTIVPQVAEWFGMSLVMPRGQYGGQLLTSMRRLARRVFGVYAGATAVFAFVFALLGLSAFDALNLSMVTLATGGCYEAALPVGTRGTMLSVALMIAMLFSAGNFVFYAEIIRRRAIQKSGGADEMKAMLLLVAAAGLVVSLHLWTSGTYGFGEGLRYGFFSAAAFLSTTGMPPAQLAGWSDFDRFVLLLLVFIGGCMASSSGGMKILRLSVLVNASIAELRRTLHPRMLLRITALGRVVPLATVGQLLSFFALYTAVFFGAAIALSFSGLAPLSAMGLSAACLTSAGPAALVAGDASVYATLGAGGRLFCAVLMILGRLEVFSFLFAIQTLVSRWERRW
ncbi:MAG: TrkH family potassium uptake protein [Schwartzia sp.]|nr:TrkH family potassium uptake protein [Schwartzia sp. (in: firmicutes)]